MIVSTRKPAHAAVAEEFDIPVGSCDPTWARFLNKLRFHLEERHN
jgi:hypothetical protein